MRRATGKFWKGKRDIYSKLLEKRMTWTDLKRETGLDHTTLSDYLKDLVDRKMIDYDPKTETYTTLAYFLRFFPAKMAEALRLIRELDHVGTIIDRGGMGGKVFEVDEATVRAHALLLAASMPFLLYNGLGGKGPYEVKPEDRRKPGFQRRLEKRISSDGHAVVDELLENLLKPWIHKLLDVLQIFSSSNEDLLTSMGGAMMEDAMREVERYDRAMENLKA